MDLSFVMHRAPILIGDYQFHDSLKKEVLSLLESSYFISKDNTNVKATRTDWNWNPDNIKLRNLKSYIREEIERVFEPGKIFGQRMHLVSHNLWANIYEKGDYAQPHDHKPNDFSFSYFVKTKWYHPPLVFGHSGRRIRPKEGTYVIFPSYLAHHVPKNRYNNTRVTLSGNFIVDSSKLLEGVV